ncbi:RNA polymerase sigma factor SigK [Nocardiopsis terrae]|uniref:RNA polymerase sigma-70 factor (ECF subfamily) n=1 Tax=Nocardiopsis terrae TaxID=372655 RepID=A0ABR9HEP1_9ACTN|nr:sigma factor [Nocardiopsis terrae]MBE1457504.1 RNA polymerase sigma-70 factor (ECF subfamily) [Nocardiopsis terrae]GHC85770.1 RNA polymerase sigma factor SigK [Nocardiopsis terrae]
MTTFVRHTPAAGLDALLTRAGSGDEQAFATLHDRGAATVHGLVLRALRDPEVTEEVTRTVWVRVWHRSGQYTPDQGSALAWVMALAQRTVVERIRSTPREAAYARTESAPTRSVSVEPDPDSPLPIATRRRAVLRAYYRGCTSEQISTVLGVPHRTVATMIHSERMHLRAHLRLVDHDVPGRATAAADAQGW